MATTVARDAKKFTSMLMWSTSLPPRSPPRALSRTQINFFFCCVMISFFPSQIFPDSRHGRQRRNWKKTTLSNLVCEHPLQLLSKWGPGRIGFLALKLVLSALWVICVRFHQERKQQPDEEGKQCMQSVAGVVRAPHTQSQSRSEQREDANARPV